MVAGSSRPRWSWLFLALINRRIFVVAQTTSTTPQVEVCAKQIETLGAKDTYCGLQWGIFQTARVAEFWAVHEVEFYWDTQCSEAFPPGLAKSSTTNTEKALKDKVNTNAWDGDESTWWAANCKALLGGCGPWDHFIGTRIGEYAVPVITDPLQEYATIRCIRLLQSPNATRFSSSVTTVVWANETGYEVIETYSALSGGYWNMRPAWEAGLWRIWNVDATEKPWKVGELLFYSDLFCENEVTGVPISSSSFGVPQSATEETYCYDLMDGCPSDPGCECDDYLAINAFNGVRLVGYSTPVALPGYWRAPCNQYNGCAALSNWIGLDFNDNPKSVNCIRIQQPTFSGYKASTYTSKILLQGWDGYEWLSVQTFNGLGHGNYSDTRPLDGYAWRLVNYDSIPEYWEVYEMALYEELDCGITTGLDAVAAGGVAGTPIHSNDALIFSEQETECLKSAGSCAALAFDQKLYTSWVSDCDGCAQRQAWVGLMSRQKSWDIKCFRIYQSPDKLHRTEALELSRWNGEEWEVQRWEGGLGSGTWNYRPSEIYTMWRLIGTSETEQPWTVAGLHFYEDAQCNGDPADAEVVAVGHEGRYTSANAVDTDPEGLTQWVVSCTAPDDTSKGCAKGSAWLGLQSSKKTFQVKCLRLYQHRLRAYQMTNAIVQFWNGITWEASDDIPTLLELGGGSWFTLPGAQASMWRLAATPVSGGYGVGFTEVAFYLTADCSGEPVKENFPNIGPIGSGHVTGQQIATKTGESGHLETMSEYVEAAPGLAFDGDLNTFWADLDLLTVGSASSSWQGWIGLDMTSQVADIKCIMFVPAPIASLQPGWAELQGWDGDVWTTQASVATNPTLVLSLPSPTTTGWQRRPEYKNSMWRLENTATQVGWEVVDIKFYGRVDCSEDYFLAPDGAIAAARSMDYGDEEGGQLFPANAFDQDLDTRWKAQCGDDGCAAGEAWIGATYLESVQVRCLKIYQSGRYEKQARTVALSSWTGEDWKIQAYYNGLGGNSWNMRPAAPDTMWRMVYKGRATEECSTLPTTPAYSRNWGVTEFKFYADDDCSEKLTGQAIASGSYEDTASRVDENVRKSYLPKLAIDSDEETFWSANCKSTTDLPRGSCEAGEEWLGLDFGQDNGGLPVEVRCISLKQSRALQSTCCDPASDIDLERWNGSAWATATWRHLDELEEDEPIIIQGDFQYLGQCPSLADKIAGKLDGSNPGIWEERSRRQSDTCEIPLSGAVKLLTNNLCAKHSLCVSGGFSTDLYACCPLDGSATMSKCCCDIPSWKIFEDEWDLGIDRTPIETYPTIGFEYVIIKLINVMPWVGIIMALLFFVLTTIPRPRKLSGANYRVWNAVCGPPQRWLAGKGLYPSICRFFLQRQPGETLLIMFGKRLAVVLVGFFIGGSSLWIAAAFFLAQILVWVMMTISVVIKLCKSPYNPKEETERKRMCVFLAIPVAPTNQEFKMPDMAKLLAGFVTGAVQTTVTFVRAVADVILLRFAMMNMGVVDVQVSVPDILDMVPNLALNLDFITDNVYELLNMVSVLFTEALVDIFEGVPRCEGPVLTFSAMWLVAITLILVRFLNYDYFGILVSVKQTVMKTRPLFQKSVGVSATLGFQSVLFMAMQMVMLLFSRALSLLFGLNVFALEASEGWNCPYEGETMSIIIGRSFLLLTGVCALGVTFISANGHLLGRKQIAGEFGNRCGLDLDGLDKDAADPSAKKIFRKTAFFSLFPTTFGIWFDWWNVEGFLVEERARVYADQLGFPEECPHCGTTHVPYPDVMKATAMQVSLAWQLLPFVGPIIGKLAEHANNPPLFYKGTKLKCFWASPNMNMVSGMKERKMTCGARLKLMGLMAMAALKDYAVPIFQRLIGVGVYLVILYCTHAINKQNLAKMGLKMFQIIMSLSVIAGYLDAFIPVVILLLIGAALIFMKKKVQAKDEDRTRKHYKSTAENIIEKTVERPTLWPLCGQVVHGVLLGGSSAIYFSKEYPDMGIDYHFLIGASIGLASGMLTLIFAYLTERVSARLVISMTYVVYCIGVAVWIMFWVGREEDIRAKIVLAVIMTAFLSSMSAMAFRPPDVDPFTGDEDPSATEPLLFSWKILAGPFGIYAGVFITIMPYTFLREWFSNFITCLLVLTAGWLGGSIYGFATHLLCERKPGQRAIVVGTVLTVGIGIGFHWLMGAIIGSVVATLVGMREEAKLMAEVNKMNLEPPRYTKSKVMASTALTKFEQPDLGYKEPFGSSLYQDPDALRDVPALPPSVCRASTPTRKGEEHPPHALQDGHEIESPSITSAPSPIVQGMPPGDSLAPSPNAGRPKPAPLQVTDDAPSPTIAAASSSSFAPGGGTAAASSTVGPDGKRQKKYAFKDRTKIVVAQGTPGYEVGQSLWQGAGRSREEDSPPSHQIAIHSPTGMAIAPDSPSAPSATTTPSAAKAPGSPSAAALAAQIKRNRLQAGVAVKEEYRAVDDSKQRKAKKDAAEQLAVSGLEAAGFAMAREGANALGANL